MAAEIVVLFAGVVSRYGSDSPLVWSDELASLLFLWLAMLGAVEAFHAGAHMRVTAIVSKSCETARAYFETLAVAARLAFLVMTIGPAFDFAADEYPAPGGQVPCRSACP